MANINRIKTISQDEISKIKNNFLRFTKIDIVLQIGQNISLKPQASRAQWYSFERIKITFRAYYITEIQLSDILCLPVRSPFSETEYVRAFISFSHILYIKFKTIFFLSLINIVIIVIYNLSIMYYYLLKICV